MLDLGDIETSSCFACIGEEGRYIRMYVLTFGLSYFQCGCFEFGECLVVEGGGEESVSELFIFSSSREECISSSWFSFLRWGGWWCGVGFWEW